MVEFTIDDAQLDRLHDQVVVLTGGSSGIGLATTQLLLSKGAFVVQGDLNAPVPSQLSVESVDRFTFVQTNVLDWLQLKRLFATAIDKYGRVDHVFANAGIAQTTDFLAEDLEPDGTPKEPDRSVLLTNFIAVMDTMKLALHYLTRNPKGGSIVLTASSSAYQRFSLVEYTAAKHGVLGIMRGLHRALSPAVPIRLNSICPSWTETGMVQSEAARKAGIRTQLPIVVARSVALLMADETRNSQLIYSCQGKYTEIEGDLLAAADGILQKAASVDVRTRTEDEELLLLLDAMQSV